MSVGPLQLLLIVVLVILLFGTKKLGNLGSDLGKAIRGFKKGMNDGDEDAKDESAHRDQAESLKADPPESADTAKTTTKDSVKDSAKGSADASKSHSDR